MFANLNLKVSQYGLLQYLEFLPVKEELYMEPGRETILKVYLNTAMIKHRSVTNRKHKEILPFFSSWKYS